MPTGQRCSHLVEAVDVLPTLLASAGIQIPPHVQGQSLLPLLTEDDFRYIAHADGQEHLYDLSEKWGEYRDVAADEKYQTILAGHCHLLLKRLIEMERPRERVWAY